MLVEPGAAVGGDREGGRLGLEDRRASSAWPGWTSVISITWVSTQPSLHQTRRVSFTGGAPELFSSTGSFGFSIGTEPLTVTWATR